MNNNLPLLFLLLLAVCSCRSGKKDRPAGYQVVDIEFSADSAYEYCSRQCDFGPRTMNSSAHEQCLEWIASQFTAFGYSVELQKAALKGYDGTTLNSTNIIATAAALAGGDSLATQPRILVCAHWDSRPWADNDADSANWRKPVMAANDGASGVAVMLELARLLGQHDSASYAVDFICFDAEDWGVPQWSDISAADSWALGAQHWAAGIDRQAAARYEFGILLDMVGGQGAHFYREGFSMKYASRVVDQIWKAAATCGYGSIFLNQEGGWITDDHVPVNETARIPCVDIISHYPDCESSNFGPTWHTVSDDMQHIDKNTLAAVGQTLVQLIFQK